MKVQRNKPNDNRPLVELHNAFCWDCDNCGKENFERAVVPSLTKEDIKYIKENHDIPEKEITKLVFFSPGDVRCSHCGSSFRSYIQGLDEIE